MVFSSPKQKGKTDQRAEAEPLTTLEHEVEQVPRRHSERQRTVSQGGGGPNMIRNSAGSYKTSPLIDAANAIENSLAVAPRSVERDGYSSPRPISSVLPEGQPFLQSCLSPHQDPSSYSTAKSNTYICDICEKGFEIPSKLKYSSPPWGPDWRLQEEGDIS